MQDLENEIRALIAEIIEREPAEITPDANFFTDLSVDSMMALEILTAVEKKYKIQIPEEKLAQFTTLKQTVAIAGEYLANKPQNA